MNTQATGRWGARASDRAGTRDMAMDVSAHTEAVLARIKFLERRGKPEDLEAAAKLKKIIEEAKSAKDFAMDPFTSKGEEIMKNMQSEYGPKKGESVFYASANKGVHGDGRWGGRGR